MIRIVLYLKLLVFYSPKQKQQKTLISNEIPFTGAFVIAYKVIKIHKLQTSWQN